VDLIRHTGLVRRRWRVVALAVVACLAVSVAVAAARTPLYTSTTRLLVPFDGAAASDHDVAAQRALLVAQLVSTAPARDAAVSAAGGGHARVSGAADGRGPFVVVRVVARSPQVAHNVAAAVALVLPRVIGDLQQNAQAVPGEGDTATSAGGLSFADVQTVDPATRPTAPSSPRWQVYLLLGLLAGLALGLVIALGSELGDRRIRGVAQVRRVLGVPLLAVVPREFAGEPVTAASHPQSRRTEAYRRVRAMLQLRPDGGAPPSVLVTSAGRSEGRTSLVANLAVAFGRAGRSVAVVEADLRDPGLAAALGLEAGPGLADVLVGRASLESALQPLPGERVVVLTAGTVAETPGELLGSPAMGRVLSQLEDRVDVVLVDAPPALAVTDALPLAARAEGVVLTAQIGRTVVADLVRMVEELQRVGATLCGVVVLEAEPDTMRMPWRRRRGPVADPAPAVPASALSAFAGTGPEAEVPRSAEVPWSAEVPRRLEREDAVVEAAPAAASDGVMVTAVVESPVRRPPTAPAPPEPRVAAGRSGAVRQPGGLGDRTLDLSGGPESQRVVDLERSRFGPGGAGRVARPRNGFAPAGGYRDGFAAAPSAPSPTAAPAPDRRANRVGTRGEGGPEAGETGYDNRPFDDKTFDDKAFDGRAFDDKAFDDRAFDDKAFDDRAYGDSGDEQVDALSHGQGDAVAPEPECRRPGPLPGPRPEVFAQPVVRSRPVRQRPGSPDPHPRPSSRPEPSAWAEPLARAEPSARMTDTMPQPGLVPPLDSASTPPLDSASTSTSTSTSTGGGGAAASRGRRRAATPDSGLPLGGAREPAMQGTGELDGRTVRPARGGQEPPPEREEPGWQDILYNQR
jgi:succinoglycan biosynthesis transport protein ExoP